MVLLVREWDFFQFSSVSSHWFDDNILYNRMFHINSQKRPPFPVTTYQLDLRKNNIFLKSLFRKTLDTSEQLLESHSSRKHTNGAACATKFREVLWALSRKKDKKQYVLLISSFVFSMSIRWHVLYRVVPPMRSHLIQIYPHTLPLFACDCTG